MRNAVRALRQPVRVVLLVGALLGALVAAPALTGPAIAHAEDEAPVKIGTQLVARGDCELQKVVITRGARVEVTGSASNSVDVVLPDGYVLKRVPMSRIRYFFDVVR